MKLISSRGFASLLAASAAALWLLPATASADIITDYHPATEARTFATSPGGWTSSADSSGACITQVNCPAVDNSYQGKGGAGGDGYLRTAISSISSAGGEVRGIWESPAFTYDGARGTVPDTLTFFMDRRADISALLTLVGTDAQYTVDLEDLTSGTAINITGPSPLAGAAGWRAIPAVTLN